MLACSTIMSKEGRACHLIGTDVLGIIYMSSLCSTYFVVYDNQHFLRISLLCLFVRFILPHMHGSGYNATSSTAPYWLITMCGS
jgi:hypothetical protein